MCNDVTEISDFQTTMCYYNYQARTRMVWVLLYTADHKFRDGPVTYRLCNRQTWSKVSTALQDDRHGPSGELHQLPSGPQFCACMQDQHIEAVFYYSLCSFWISCDHILVWVVSVWASVWCGGYKCVMLLIMLCCLTLTFASLELLNNSPLR